MFAPQSAAAPAAAPTPPTAPPAAGAGPAGAPWAGAAGLNITFNNDAHCGAFHVHYHVGHGGEASANIATTNNN